MTGYQSKRAAAQDKLVRMTKDEALKLALEALEQTLQTLDDENSKPGGAIADTIWHTKHETLFDYLGSEITAIKEALVQPEQEPWPEEPFGHMAGGVQPPQRPWVNLTDNQIEQIYYDLVKIHRGAPMPWGQIQFGKVLQAAIREANK